MGQTIYRIGIIAFHYSYYSCFTPTFLPPFIPQIILRPKIILVFLYSSPLVHLIFHLDRFTGTLQIFTHSELPVDFPDIMLHFICDDIACDQYYCQTKEVLFGLGPTALRRFFLLSLRKDSSNTPIGVFPNTLVA